jgi:hypothetical protein
MQIIQLSRPPTAFLQWLCIFKNKKQKENYKNWTIRHLSNLLYVIYSEHRIFW